MPLPAQAQLGPPRPVNLVVFSDFECPFSAAQFFVLEKLQRAEPGRVHVLFRQTPLPIHPGAPLAHRAELAAARQNRGPAMAELLFGSQQHRAGGLDRLTLVSYARQLHLDVARFTRDLDSPEVAAALAADLAEGEALGVEETPTIFVGGKKLVGEQTEQTLLAAIDSQAGLKGPTALNGQAPANGGQPAPPAAAAPVLDRGMVARLSAAPTAEKGDPNAPVTIVEFTDFQCPFCRSAVAPMEQLMEARGREVRWIFRAFPLDFHQNAELAAEAALAAGEQGRFWAMHDLLFSNQSALQPADLRTYARQIGLDLPRFDLALATHRFAGQVAADRALGQLAGVDGTPTFIVDGQVVTGIRSLPELTSMVDAHTADHGGRLLAESGPVAAPSPSPEYRIAGSASPVPLTITWFTDVRSPLAAGQEELIRGLIARYGTRVRVLFKPLPLPNHADAPLGGAALLAALAQDRFWPMFDALSSRRDTLTERDVLQLAAGLKLDPASFQTGLAAGLAQVDAGRQELARRAIAGAPVIFLNDQRVDGLQREAFYERIADSELGKAGAAVR